MFQSCVHFIYIIRFGTLWGFRIHNYWIHSHYSLVSCLYLRLLPFPFWITVSTILPGSGSNSNFYPVVCCQTPWSLIMKLYTQVLKMMKHPSKKKILDPEFNHPFNISWKFVHNFSSCFADKQTNAGVTKTRNERRDEPCLQQQEPSLGQRICAWSVWFGSCPIC